MIHHENGSLCMIFVWRLNHITFYRFCFKFPLIRDEPFLLGTRFNDANRRYLEMLMSVPDLHLNM